MLESDKIFGIKKEWLLNTFFFLFITLVIGNRVALFFTININAIDNDQVIMWLGAKHYSQGLFYEPRFYGQDYNTLMEAIFAVPFMWCGLPVYYAVPLATHLIFLTPFLFIASYLFINKHKQKAILVLSIVLCMPMAYDIMNSLPRGFVTGLFFTTLFVVSLYNPHNYRLILVNTFLAYVGFLVNQNSVLVSAPFLFYLFLINYKNKKYYSYSVIGLIIAFPIDYALNHFYKIHPEYNLYGFKHIFSLQYFTDAINHLDDRFAHIGLFFEGTCIITVLLFLILGIYFFIKNKAWFYTFLVFMSIILFSFFSSKSADGSTWSFFSYSRMYLGIPLFFVLCVCVISFNFNIIIYVVMVVTISYTTFKAVHFNTSIAYHVDEKKWTHLNLCTLKELFSTLETYKKFCIENRSSDLVIIDNVWRADIINYAGPALFNDYPKTFKPSFERRRWIVEKEKTHAPERFVILTPYKDFDKTVAEKYKDITIKRIDDWGCFLISNNKRNMVNFVKYIGGATDGF